MDDMYRMLGRGHQADLEREAATRRLAAEARRRPITAAGTSRKERLQTRAQLAITQAATFLSRAPRVEV
jgi:hypothetical protein